MACFYNSLLPSNAFVSVTSSVYSKSPPTGIPCAILVTFTPKGFNNFDIYIDVASPSTLGLVAIITSFIFPSDILFNNYFIFISSGPIPFIGEIVPCNT